MKLLKWSCSKQANNMNNDFLKGGELTMLPDWSYVASSDPSK